MCYVDPDYLSVQQRSFSSASDSSSSSSVNTDNNVCLKKFFANRKKPKNCQLNIQLNTLIKPNLLKKIVKNNVLVVRSAPRHNEYRHYIRQTWKRDIEPDIPVIFVSGRDNFDLSNESLKYNDILQLDFADSYQNLTMKMMGIYRFFLNQTNVKHIVVINDDTIVNATALKNIFNKRIIKNNYLNYSSNINESTYLIGKVSRGYPRLFFPWLPWYVSSKEYSHKCYPPFIQGSSFVISRKAASKILKRICDFPSIHLDDVMMGILTNCLNIKNLHYDGFDHHLPNNFVVFHYQFARYTANEMQKLYNKVKKLL